MNALLRCSLLILVLTLAGCATPQHYDYSNYRAHPPRSILVLPPLNKSTAVEGTYSYLSTVTRPLAEMGYYVFPVQVVDQYLKENGMPTAGEMHQVPPGKLAEIIGADAVLYITLDQYGSKYQLIVSSVTVEVSAQLIDTRTGLLLWQGHGIAQNSSNSSGGGLLGSIISAALSQALNSTTDAAHGVCRLANSQLFFTLDRSLPYGPYSPEYTRQKY